MRQSPKPSGMLQRSEVKQVSCILSTIRINILEKETTSNLETLQSITKRYQRIGNPTVIQVLGMLQRSEVRQVLARLIVLKKDFKLFYL